MRGPRRQARVGAATAEGVEASLQESPQGAIDEEDPLT
jgi:hypothetical protein